jgi:prepilin-type N-terminal cleavage/methylation domain-containing protein
MLFTRSAVRIRLINNFRYSESGFSLVELLAAMVVSGVVFTMALNAMVQTSRDDRIEAKNTEATTSLGIAQSTIGDDIRQSGEFIEDKFFPVVQIADGGTSLTVRKAWMSPIRSCQSIGKGSVHTQIVTATGSCGDALDKLAKPNLPQSLRAMRNLRCTVGKSGDFSNLTKDYCASAGSTTEVLLGYLSDGNGNSRSFQIDGEYTSGSIYGLSVSGLSSDTVNDYPLGSAIYAIEERVYAFNSAKSAITLSINGGVPQVLISKVKSFSVSAKTFSDPVNRVVDLAPLPKADRCADSPTYLCNVAGNFDWKSIAGVKVVVTSLPTPVTPESSMTGEYFPRNILSR